MYIFYNQWSCINNYLISANTMQPWGFMVRYCTGNPTLRTSLGEHIPHEIFRIISIFLYIYLSIKIGIYVKLWRFVIFNKWMHPYVEKHCLMIILVHMFATYKSMRYCLVIFLLLMYCLGGIALRTSLGNHLPHQMVRILFVYVYIYILTNDYNCVLKTKVGAFCSIYIYIEKYKCLNKLFFEWGKKWIQYQNREISWGRYCLVIAILRTSHVNHVPVQIMRLDHIYIYIQITRCLSRHVFVPGQRSIALGAGIRAPIAFVASVSPGEKKPQTWLPPLAWGPTWRKAAPNRYTHIYIYVDR